MEKKLFGIPRDYTIQNREFTETEIHLYVRPHKRKSAICSGCGKIHKEGYHSSSVVKALDLPVAGRKVYWHVTRRKYRCPVDGKIYVEHIDWLKKRVDIRPDIAKKSFD